MSKLTLNNLSQLSTNENSAVNAINTNNSTLVSAFDNTLSRDGSVPNSMEADFDMNSKRILNLPSPTTPGEPVRLQDITGIQILTGLSTSVTEFNCTAAYVADADNLHYDYTLTVIGTPPASLTAGMRFHFVAPNTTLSYLYKLKIAGVSNSFAKVYASDGFSQAFGMDLQYNQTVTIEYTSNNTWAIVSGSKAGPMATVMREASVVVQTDPSVDGKLFFITDNYGGRILLSNSSGIWHNATILGNAKVFYVFDAVHDPAGPLGDSTYNANIWVNGTQNVPLARDSFYYMYAFLGSDSNDIQLSFRTPTNTSYNTVNKDSFIVNTLFPYERHIGMVYTRNNSVLWVGSNQGARTQNLVRCITSEQLLPMQTSKVTGTAISSDGWKTLDCSASVVFSGVTKLPMVWLNANYQNTTANTLGKIRIVGTGVNVLGTSGVVVSTVTSHESKATCNAISAWSQMNAQISQSWADGYYEFVPQVWVDGGTGTFEVDIMTSTWQ